MIYELINPSDKCTLEADSLAVAAFAAVMLSGHYGVKLADERQAEEAGPDGMFFEFFGAVERWTKRWGDPQDFLEAHLDDLIACFESFAYLSGDERQRYFRALELIDDPAKRTLFRQEHEDRVRSSCTAICKAAWRYAEQFREIKTAPTKPAGKARSR